MKKWMIATLLMSSPIAALGATDAGSQPGGKACEQAAINVGLAVNDPSLKHLNQYTATIDATRLVQPQYGTYEYDVDVLPKGQQVGNEVYTVTARMYNGQCFISSVVLSSED